MRLIVLVVSLFVSASAFAGSLSRPVPVEDLHWTKPGGGEFVSTALDRAARFLPAHAVVVGTECLASTQKDIECVFLYTFLDRDVLEEGN